MKRFISIFICLAMLCSKAFAQTGVDDEKYKLAAGLINSLSESYVLAADRHTQVTRAEFIYTLMNVLGQKGDDTDFEDITPRHFAYEAVCAAQKGQLLEQSSMFFPDKAITYQNAARFAVSILGYGDKAEYYGGYPMGYTRVADELKLTKGMSGKEMTVENSVVFIFNTLCAKVLDVASIKKNIITFTQSEDTLLKRYRGVVSVEGVVSADGASGLTDVKQACANGNIVVSGIVCRGVEERGLLGRNCIVFYHDDGVNTAVYAAVYDCDMVSVDMRFCTDVSEGRLNFISENSKSKSVKLDKSYTVIYNGCASERDIDFSVGAERSGVVTLIDNDNDGDYDVLDMIEYEYAYVSGKDDSQRIIFDRVGGKSIDMSDENIILTVSGFAAGEMGDFSDIERDSLIAYAVSESGLVYDVVICSDNTEGVITDIYDADYGKVAVLGGIEYYISDYIFNDTEKLIGVSGVFYKGVNGELVYAITNSQAMHYGWIKSLGYDEEEYAPCVRMFTELGENVVLRLRNKVLMDGSSIAAEAALKSLNDIAAEGDNKRLVKYKLSDGEISVIDTPSEMDKINSLGSSNSDDSMKIYITGEKTYRTTAGFAPNFNINAMTAVFVIPSENKRADSQSYKIEDISWFINDFEYNITAYDVSGGAMAGAVLVIADEASDFGVEQDAASAVVAGKRITIDDDNMPLCVLTLWEKGRFNEYTCGGDYYNVSEGIDKGDIIRYRAKGTEIRAAAIDYDCSAGKINSGVTGAGKRLEYYKGKVFSIDSGCAYSFVGGTDIELPVDISSLRYNMLAGVDTVFVDIGFDGSISVKNAASDSIRDFQSSGNNADEIIVRQRYYVTQLNVIYRRNDR